ncbi:Flp pilus assembly protein CpaB [Acetobacter sacchari]|uniref:Flp pilus assembly protein CpaB n=1 Tax=Acetobacter sacchari TaxID=2661687 RepID=A0ABS3LY56_9PROT|nr:Flp pilus assembly protein CpaB [Acetobacter sacchari]MBO1360853.1 Flp pilus assembly protein CpaB [Acetobacter sacchari]
MLNQNIHRYIPYVCIFFLGGTSLYALLKSAARPPAQIHDAVATIKPEPKISVLVAEHQLYAGSVIKSGDLAGVQTPKSFVFPGAIVESDSSRHDLTGALLRVSIPKGAQIRAEDVVHPGEGGFLASLLGAGLRGVAVAVDPATSAGGLIWPGDFVDVILTVSDTSEGVGPKNTTSKIILSDIRVVAVDRRLVRGKDPSKSEEYPKNIVLELTPIQAQKLSLATKIGKITLSLRSAFHGVGEKDLVSDSSSFDFFDNNRSKSSVAPATALRVFNGRVEVKSEN